MNLHKEENNKGMAAGAKNIQTPVHLVGNSMNHKKEEKPAGISGVSPSEDESQKNPMKWFVMRDLKRANAKLPAYKLLEQKNVRVYTPMKEKQVLKNGRSIQQSVPMVHGLLFVHDTFEHIEPIVESIATLQFCYARGKQKEPTVVRDRDMENFIQAGEDYASVQYYSTDEITSEMLKRKVRVMGGPFDQREGYLLTRQGSKSKRLLVGIPNFIYKSVGIYDYDNLVQI